MIKELGRNNETNWSEKIQIELPLSDLQILYDSIGAMPPQYLKIKHKCTKFNHDNYTDMINDIYEGLHNILLEHNGVTDDDPMANIEIELEITGE